MLIITRPSLTDVDSSLSIVCTTSGRLVHKTELETPITSIQQSLALMSILSFKAKSRDTDVAGRF